MVDVAGHGALVDDDEEVEVGVVVEPLALLAGGAEPEQRDHVATAGQVGAELVEPAQSRVGGGRGHHRSSL